MIVFSCDRINEEAPYEVSLLSLSAKKTELEFRTDGNLHYIVSFIEDVNIYARDAYQFAFTEACNNRGDKDIKVVKTLIAILKNFFRDNSHIMLFICYDMDNAGAARSRLFKSWYSKYNERDLYYMNSKAIDLGGFFYYTAMVCRNDREDFQTCIEQFEAFFEEL